MRSRARATAALALAAALALSTACSRSPDGGAAAAEVPAVDAESAAELAELFHQTRANEAELRDAENVLIADCLEDAGHTVHDRSTLPEPDDETAPIDQYPFDAWLPDLETAEERGFGVWAEQGGVAGYEAVDNTAFESLPADERRAWYVAYGGDAWAQAYHAADYLTESELTELARQAGIDAEGPQPGGCLLEMIETVYGAPASGSNWRPRAPVSEYDFDPAQLLPAWHESLLDAESAMTACLADRGHGDWRFDDHGALPVLAHWHAAYRGDTSGLPADFDGKQTAEIAMATGFASCAEDSGYRESAAESWDRLHYEAYSAVESELRAWSAAVDEALANALEQGAA